MGQKATVRTLYGKTDRFKIEIGILQGCLLSPCLFNLYSEYILKNVELEELQVGVKIGGENISNLNYPGMIPQEESERAGLKLSILKKQTKIMSSSPITSWEIQGAKLEIVTDFLFLGTKINVVGDCSHEIRGGLFLGQDSSDKPR